MITKYMLIIVFYSGKIEHYIYEDYYECKKHERMEIVYHGGLKYISDIKCINLER
jgi:hypothetical protein